MCYSHVTRHVTVTVATGSSPGAAAVSKRRTVSSKGAVETEKPVNYAVVIAKDKIKVSIVGGADSHSGCGLYLEAF